MSTAADEELLRVIEDLADDREAEINARYAGTQDTYPSERLRYDRDMASVLAARRLIARKRLVG